MSGSVGAFVLGVADEFLMLTDSIDVEREFTQSTCR